jgi:hypothetical protein
MSPTFVGFIDIGLPVRWVHSPGIHNNPSEFYQVFCVSPADLAEYNHPPFPGEIEDGYQNPDAINSIRLVKDMRQVADIRSIGADGISLIKFPEGVKLHEVDNRRNHWIILILYHKTYSVDLEKFRVLWLKITLIADKLKIAIAFNSTFNYWDSLNQPFSFTWDKTNSGWGTPWDDTVRYESEWKKNLPRYKIWLRDLQFINLAAPFADWWIRYPSWMRGVDYPSRK